MIPDQALFCPVFGRQAIELDDQLLERHIEWGSYYVQGERKTAGRLASLPRIVSLADINLDQHQEADENGVYACEAAPVGARFHSEAVPATRLNSSLRDLLHAHRQVSFLDAADPRSSPVVRACPLKHDDPRKR